MKAGRNGHYPERDADPEFPRRLRKLRLMQGWSQRELADETEGRISSRTIRAWEAGENLPWPGPQLRAVAWVLRVSPGYLLMGEKGEL